MESAKRLKAFGVEIWGWNTDGRDIKYFDKSYSKEDKNEVKSNCDIVISTIPSTKETYKLMNEEKFAVMKENSSFINVGRGNVVDEEDLLKYANKKINITKMEKCNYNNLDIYIVNIEYDKESTDIVVFSDYSNSTYSIMPKEYFNDIENIQSIIKNLDIKYIDKNKNNEIKKVELTDQQICLQYYSDYID